MLDDSPNVTTTPRGSPPAADDVDTTNIGLLKEEEESTNINSFDCCIFS